jgi:hypothetical protein
MVIIPRKADLLQAWSLFHDSITDDGVLPVHGYSFWRLVAKTVLYFVSKS